MERVVSATEARIHFGELMRRVVKNQEAVIVERGGQPQIVIMAVAEYDQMKANQKPAEWQQVLKQADEIREKIMARRQGQPLPPADEIIRQMRAERDEQLLSLR